MAEKVLNTMTTNKSGRTPDYDKEMVKKYLETFPEPSVGTMNGFNAPEAWADEWAEFLKEGWRHKMQTFRKVMPNENVALGGLPVVPIRKLSPDEMDDLIELEPCQVVSMSQQTPFDEWIRFRCLHCKTEYGPYDKMDVWAKPRKCNCDASNIVETTHPKIDSVVSQWVKVQELQNESGDPPQFLNCLVKGKPLMWHVTFHERVSFIGIFHYTRITNKDGTTGYKPWLEVFGIKKQDPESSIPLSDKDIAYIQAEQKKPDFYERFVKSFAPHIFGMTEFKEAAVIALASMKLEFPARVLFVTDPSMGKSELLKYAASVVPGSQHTQMGRSSKAGLTVISKRDPETGVDHIQRGAVVAAHKRVLCIDEMQMGKADDFMNLNEMLESGKVRYAMAGGTGYMEANCAILMACNPHAGKFAGDEQSLTEILEFMGNDLPQFVSRINLVLMMRDNRTPEEQDRIADHMADHNRNDPLAMARYQENWYDENDIEEVALQTPIMGFTIIVKGPAPRYGTKWIKKIIKYVTNNVPVERMTPEQKKALVQYYKQSASDVVTSVNKLLTLRFLRHAIDIAQYMARLQGKSTPEDIDVRRAMLLLEKTLSVAAFDPKNKDVPDVNMFNGNFSKEKLERDSAMTKQQQFDDAIRKAMAQEEGKEYFTQDDIEFHLNMFPSSKWKVGSGTNAELDSAAIEHELKKRHDKGKLMEKHGQGKYTPV